MAELKKKLKIIKVQKLFLVVVFLKITSSVMSWLFGSPWILGFIVPLTFMAGYIAIGLQRSQYDVSDEKFADSCYYLGFIFTISSIVVSLVDLPNLQSNLSDIAVRFGAAMVSTVLGLIVRVYLVNFKMDSSDLTKELEEQIIESANAFRVHLEIAVDKLKVFELAVDESVKDTVTRVEIAIEKTAHGFSQEFKDTFNIISNQIAQAAGQSTIHLKELAGVTMIAADQSADHLSKVSVEMSHALKDFSTVIMADMQKFETGINKFTTAIDMRLSEIQFPDEYFSEVLKPPLQNLSISVDEIGTEIGVLSNSLKLNNRKLVTALDKVSDSAEKITSSMEHVNIAIDAQQAILDVAQKQSSTFEGLSSTIKILEESLRNSVALLDKHKDSIESIADGSKNLNSIVKDELINYINNNVQISTKTSDDVKQVIQSLESLSNKVGELSNEAIAASLNKGFKINFDHEPISTSLDQPTSPETISISDEPFIETTKLDRKEPVNKIGSFFKSFHRDN